MDEYTITILLTISILVITFVLIFAFVFIIGKAMLKGRVIIEERIDLDPNTMQLEYYVSLKNTRAKDTYIRDFGILIHPYQVPLSKRMSNTEQSYLEIESHDEFKVDLSYLINSKLLDNNKAKVYFYYDDAFSTRHLKKTRLLRKYLALMKKKNV